MRKISAFTLLALATCLQSVQAEPAALDADSRHQPHQPAQSQAIDDAADPTGELLINALASIGVPYRYGGTSAETGFDCSGFVLTTFDRALGLKLPRTAAEQAAATHKIKRSDLQPGDLVFFNTMRRAYSHVGIYVGEGRFIHSPRTGARVRVESMQTNYWQKRFNGARRVLGQDNMPGLTASTASSHAFKSVRASSSSSRISRKGKVRVGSLGNRASSGT